MKLYHIDVSLLRQLMRTANPPVTNNDISRLLNIQPTSVSRMYKSGRTRPEHMEKLCAMLNVPSDYLLKKQPTLFKSEADDKPEPAAPHQNAEDCTRLREDNSKLMDRVFELLNKVERLYEELRKRDAIIAEMRATEQMGFRAGDEHHKTA